MNNLACQTRSRCQFHLQSKKVGPTWPKNCSIKVGGSFTLKKKQPGDLALENANNSIVHLYAANKKRSTQEMWTTYARSLVTSPRSLCHLLEPSIKFVRNHSYNFMDQTSSIIDMQHGLCEVERLTSYPKDPWHWHICYIWLMAIYFLVTCGYSNIPFIHGSYRTASAQRFLSFPMGVSNFVST